MGLAAPLHVGLEPPAIRSAPRSPRHRVRLRRGAPGRASGRRPRSGRGARREPPTGSGPAANARPSRIARNSPSAAVTPSTVASREALTISATATASIALAHRRLVRVDVPFDRRTRTLRRRPPAPIAVAMTRTSFVDSAAAFSAASRTFGLFGSTITCSALTAVIASRIWPHRRVHRLPALDHDRSAFAAEDVAVARRPGRRRRAPTSDGRRLRRGVELCEPPLALRRLAVHVADLDPLGVDDADRPPERERALRLVGVDVHLRDRGVAGHEERVAERLEARVQRVEIESRRPPRRTRCSTGTRTPRGGSTPP